MANVSRGSRFGAGHSEHLAQDAALTQTAESTFLSTLRHSLP